MWYGFVLHVFWNYDIDECVFWDVTIVIDEFIY